MQLLCTFLKCFIKYHTFVITFHIFICWPLHLVNPGSALASSNAQNAYAQVVYMHLLTYPISSG